MTEAFIKMAHGSGGQSTSELIAGIFAKYFHNEYLDAMGDAAVVPGSGRIAMTTDSFVVTPYFYPGGDIGRLCICGTVNDLLMSGAVPRYLTFGCILEEGMPTDALERIVQSAAQTAAEAHVQIVAGDTKVIENGGHPEGGIIINTAGVGSVPEGRHVGADQIREEDAVIISGTLGEHHAAILGKRMGLDNSIRSDNAPLGEMTSALFAAGVRVRAMRDVTRGGLATVMHEFASESGKTIILEEKALPVRREVRDFCGILGLDPLYMGNEGKMAVVVDPADAEKALEAIRGSRYGQDAAVIGEVAAADRMQGRGAGAQDPGGKLLLRTPVGGLRVLGPLYGEGLPRIC